MHIVRALTDLRSTGLKNVLGYYNFETALDLLNNAFNDSATQFQNGNYNVTQIPNYYDIGNRLAQFDLQPGWGQEIPHIAQQWQWFPENATVVPSMELAQYEVYVYTNIAEVRVCLSFDRKGTHQCASSMKSPSVTRSSKRRRT